MRKIFRKPRTIVFALFLVLPVSPMLFQLDAQDINKKSAGDLIWADEFDGTGIPDVTKWERQEYNRRNNVNGPDGWWSNQDSYLDGNGNLVIRVRKIANKNADGDSCDYSVGMVRSKGRFEQLYGKFEIRCQLPTQPGWWVAFWMMQGNVSAEGNGGVDGTEVDIMEGFGWTNKINLAFHWDGYGAAHKSIGKQNFPAGIRDGFHTFAMEWYPEMYVFFTDGVETWRSTGGGVCNRPGYVKVTGEISTEDWAINNYWANNPKNATYPDSFIIDYVRVYELGEFQNAVGVNAVSLTNGLTLYPNPVGNKFTIHWDPNQFPGEPEISIFDVTGQLVKSFGAVQNNSGLFSGDLRKGMYLLAVKRGDSLEYIKFIKS